jgi:hypothetical protein
MGAPGELLRLAFTTTIVGLILTVATRLSLAGCQPRLRIQGEEDGVAEVDGALAKYRVSGDHAGRCGIWNVTIWRVDGQLALRIENRQGLTLFRRASNGALAAALIDSWLHPDFGALGWERSEPNDRLFSSPARGKRRVRVEAARESSAAAEPASRGDPERTNTPVANAPAPSPASPEPAPPVQAEPIEGILRAVPANTADAPFTRSYSLLIGPEIAAGSDGSLWAGGRLGACWSFARFCGGFVVQGATSTVGGVGEPDVFRRTNADVLATIAVPIAFRSVVVLPEAGIGAGFQRATLSSGPADPVLSDALARTLTWGPRSMARLTLIIPMGRRLALDFSGAVDTAWAWDGRAVDPDDLPAEPRAFFKGGVAVRYGAP